MRGIENQVVAVTGGGGGIGREICIRFGEEGARVAVRDFAGEGEYGEKLREGLRRAIPMRRLGQPDDIPGIVAFLASDDAGARLRDRWWQRARNTLRSHDRVRASPIRASRSKGRLGRSRLRNGVPRANAATESFRGLASLGMQSLALYYGTEESKEGVRAFQEKRKPDFRKYQR